jgi:hypothetical protein
LNVREHDINGTITQLGIYFSRYGMLFKFDPRVTGDLVFATVDELKYRKVHPSAIKSIIEYRKEIWTEVEEDIKEYQGVLNGN